MVTRKREVLARLRGVPPPHADEQAAGEVVAEDRDTRAARRSRHAEHAATADRWRRIATAAYLRAERRGFSGDAQLEDWLEAEKEVDEQLMREAKAPQT